MFNIVAVSFMSTFFLRPRPNVPWSEGLPEEMFRLATQFLSPKDLGCCIRVCKSWQRMIDSNDRIWEAKAAKVGISIANLFPLRIRNFPEVQGYFSSCQARGSFLQVRHARAKDVFANPYPKLAFGRSEWLKFLGIDPGPAPALPWYIHQLLDSPCPFWPGKKRGETHTLMQIPKEVIMRVEGRDVRIAFGVELLDQLIRKRGGLGIRDRIENHETLKVTKNQWVLITNDILPNSEGQSWDEQKKLVAKYARYQIPSTVITSIVSLVKTNQTQQFMFGAGTYTHCIEPNRSGKGMIGNFDQHGLTICQTDLTVWDEDSGEALEMDGPDTGIVAFIEFN